MNALAVVLALALRPQPPQSGAVANSADARLAARVAGCYALVPGPWMRDGALGQPYPPATVAMRLRLAADPFVVGGDEHGGPGHPGRGAFRAAVLPGPEQPPGAVAYTMFWQRVWPGADTILVTHVHAVAGVNLMLAPVGRGLAGWITAYTDRVQPGKPQRTSRPVRARRILCPPTPADSGAGAA